MSSSSSSSSSSSAPPPPPPPPPPPAHYALVALEDVRAAHVGWELQLFGELAELRLPGAGDGAPTALLLGAEPRRRSNGRGGARGARRARLEVNLEGVPGWLVRSRVWRAQGGVVHVLGTLTARAAEGDEGEGGGEGEGGAGGGGAGGEPAEPELELRAVSVARAEGVELRAAARLARAREGYFADLQRCARGGARPAFLPPGLWALHALHAAEPPLLCRHLDPAFAPRSAAEAACAAALGADPDLPQSAFLHAAHPLRACELAGVVASAPTAVASGGGGGSGALVADRFAGDGARTRFLLDDGSGAAQVRLFSAARDGTPNAHPALRVGDVVLVGGGLGWGFDSIRNRGGGGRVRELSASWLRVVEPADAGALLGHWARALAALRGALARPLAHFLPRDAPLPASLRPAPPVAGAPARRSLREQLAAARRARHAERRRARACAGAGAGAGGAALAGASSPAPPSPGAAPSPSSLFLQLLLLAAPALRAHHPHARLLGGPAAAATAAASGAGAGAGAGAGVGAGAARRRLDGGAAVRPRLEAGAGAGAGAGARRASKRARLRAAGFGGASDEGSVDSSDDDAAGGSGAEDEDEDEEEEGDREREDAAAEAAAAAGSGGGGGGGGGAGPGSQRRHEAIEEDGWTFVSGSAADADGGAGAEGEGNAAPSSSAAPAGAAGAATAAAAEAAAAAAGTQPEPAAALAPPAPAAAAAAPAPAVTPLPEFFTAAHLARLLCELNPGLCALAAAATAAAAAGSAAGASAPAAAAARRAELTRIAALLLQQLSRDAVVAAADAARAGRGRFRLLSLRGTVLPAVRAAVREAVADWRAAHRDFRERQAEHQAAGGAAGAGAGAGVGAPAPAPPKELVVSLESLLDRARALEPALRNLARRTLAQGAELLEAAGVLVRLRGESYQVFQEPDAADEFPAASEVAFGGAGGAGGSGGAGGDDDEVVAFEVPEPETAGV